MECSFFIIKNGDFLVEFHQDPKHIMTKLNGNLYDIMSDNVIKHVILHCIYYIDHVLVVCTQAQIIGTF